MIMAHLHDGVVLLPRPECTIKVLSYSILSSLLGIKRQLQNNISMTIETFNSILVLVVK